LPILGIPAFYMFISPPGSNSFRSGLMFYRRCFFLFCQREITRMSRNAFALGLSLKVSKHINIVTVLVD